MYVEISGFTPYVETPMEEAWRKAVEKNGFKLNKIKIEKGKLVNILDDDGKFVERIANKGIVKTMYERSFRGSKEIREEPNLYENMGILLKDYIENIANPRTFAEFFGIETKDNAKNYYRIWFFVKGGNVRGFDEEGKGGDLVTKLLGIKESSSYEEIRNNINLEVGQEKKISYEEFFNRLLKQS